MTLSLRNQFGMVRNTLNDKVYLFMKIRYKGRYLPLKGLLIKLDNQPAGIPMLNALQLKHISLSSIKRYS